LPLEQAKAAARDLLSTKGKSEPRDWIAGLNQLAANEVGRAAIERQRRQWPLNLMGMRTQQTPRWKADPKSIDPNPSRESWILSACSRTTLSRHPKLSRVT